MLKKHYYICSYNSFSILLVSRSVQIPFEGNFICCNDVTSDLKAWLNTISVSPPPGGQKLVPPLNNETVAFKSETNLNTQCVPNVRKGQTDGVRSQTQTPSDLGL